MVSSAELLSRMQQTAAVTAAPVNRSKGKPSICFVAPTTYPVFAGDRNIRFVGGAEVQQSLLAAELAQRGYPVSMISIDYGQREGEVLNGVRLLKMHKPNAGLPGFRFLHPRVTSVWAAMRRADADVYYQRASGVHTGLVAAFARRYQRVSVFAAAHDHDFRPDPPSLRLRRDRMIFGWGIRRVTRVVTQTERQQALCREVFGRESVHIDSAYGHRGEPAAHSGVVLWVANAKRHKRPHLFLELAARLPQYRFRLVGGPADQAEERRYFEELQARAKVLPNVEMTGYVPYADIESMFDGAAIFVNYFGRRRLPEYFHAGMVTRHSDRVVLRPADAPGRRRSRHRRRQRRSDGRYGALAEGGRCVVEYCERTLAPCVRADPLTCPGGYLVRAADR